jgi:hypothetical protein
LLHRNKSVCEFAVLTRQSICALPHENRRVFVRENNTCCGLFR